MRGIVRATKPYARANKIDKYSYLMWNSQAFVKALHKIGAKKCSDCFWPIVQYWLLIFVVELSEFPPTSTYKSLTLCIGKRRCRSIMDKGSLEVFLNADCWRCLLNCQCFLLFLSIGTYKCFADCWRCLLNCQCFPRFLSIGTCPISGCGISGDTKEAVALFRQQTNTQIFYQRRHVQIFWNTHTYITIGQKVNVCKWVLARSIWFAGVQRGFFPLDFQYSNEKRNSSQKELFLSSKKIGANNHLVRWASFFSFREEQLRKPRGNTIVIIILVFRCNTIIIIITLLQVYNNHHHHLIALAGVTQPSSLSCCRCNTIIIILLQVYTKMMQSGLEEGVVAVERERARVNKIINDKVITFNHWEEIKKLKYCS